MIKFSRYLLFLVTLIAVGCETQNSKRTGDCIPVKALRGICGTAVFKIQDPAYYHLGESADGDNNVFVAALECFDVETHANPDEQDIFQDQLLYVELNPENFNEDCMRCMALINYSGEKHYKVRVHQSCLSSETE